jgi:hypothetical protein
LVRIEHVDGIFADRLAVARKTVREARSKPLQARPFVFLGALVVRLLGQVEAALKGKGKDGKDVDLVVGNDGSFVPADKFNGANSGRTSAENALKAAAEALKAIGGSGDPAKIADDVKTAQSTIATLNANHQKEIARIQKNTALRLALNDKAHDPADIISLLDLDKIEVDDAGALKTDLDGLLKPIQTSKPYLFKSQEPDKNPTVKGAKPADPGARQEPAAKVDGPVVI